MNLFYYLLDLELSWSMPKQAYFFIPFPAKYLVS